jgi:hypothetical protein
VADNGVEPTISYIDTRCDEPDGGWLLSEVDLSLLEPPRGHPVITSREIWTKEGLTCHSPTPVRLLIAF